MASPVRGVLLDAAGTLIRPARPVGETYARAAADHGTEMDPEALTGAFRRVFPRMPPMAFPPVDEHELELLERGWWRRLVRDVIAECAAPMADFDAFFDDLFARFARGDAWELFPDVVPALDALAAREVPTVVVSNFDSRLVGILEGLGVRERFRAVVFSTRAGAAKPDARIFLQALAVLDIAPEQALHVGDHREADYEGARAAGIAARWLARDGRPRSHPEVIHDLGKLVSLLD